MMRTFCLYCLRAFGWSWDASVPDYLKSIICVAPHTSNWDFILGKVFYTAMGRNANFLIKKDWFIFPFNLFFGPIGGIPVDRSKSTSLVEQLVHKCDNSERFNLAITPEGTRKRNPNWKRGFYYIAKQSKIPIVLTCIDYQKKHIYMEKIIIPTDNEKEDMLQIKRYYQQYAVGKHPELFSTGLEEE